MNKKQHAIKNKSFQLAVRIVKPYQYIVSSFKEFESISSNATELLKMLRSAIPTSKTNNNLQLTTYNL